MATIQSFVRIEQRFSPHRFAIEETRIEISVAQLIYSHKIDYDHNNIEPVRSQDVSEENYLRSQILGAISTQSEILLVATQF